jgi:glycosyltransferase involved in cell wall biosynthesis
LDKNLKNLFHNPLVSVIMPVYNGEKYIEQSIISVINQSYINWELIIIDDGSTDNTKIKVNALRLVDKRIKYYYQKNCGQAKARNLGVHFSVGDYLAFLDSDDLWYPNKLKITIEAFLNNPEIHLVYTGFDYIDESNILLDRCFIHPDIYNIHNSLLKFDFIGTLTVIIKKTIFLEVNGFDEKLYGTEDWDLWIRVSSNYNIKYIDLILSSYRENPNGSSKKVFKHFYNELKIFYKSLRFFYKIPILDKIEVISFIFSKPQLENKYILIKFCFKIVRKLLFLIYKLLNFYL